MLNLFDLFVDEYLFMFSFTIWYVFIISSHKVNFIFASVFISSSVIDDVEEMFYNYDDLSLLLDFLYTGKRK